MKNILVLATLAAVSCNALANDVCDKASKEFSQAVEVYKKEGALLL